MYVLFLAIIVELLKDEIKSYMDRLTKHFRVLGFLIAINLQNTLLKYPRDINITLLYIFLRHSLVVLELFLHFIKQMKSLEESKSSIRDNGKSPR